MAKHNRRKKKKKTHGALENESGQNALVTNEENKIPKSLVIRRGKCDIEVGTLVDDMRKLMLPYTAINFEEDPKNRKLTLAKYCTFLALPMGITHIMAFSQNKQHLNLRLAKTPEGPTMTFRVHKFSLSKNIKSLQRRPIADNNRSIHQNPPIVVTNNFGDASASPHIKLMRITFQNMFPPINVATVKLTECRRVVLFHLLEEEVDDDDEDGDDDENEDTKQQKSTKEKRKISVVHIRHYAIKAAPVGINRKVRRLIQTKIPNLNKVDDIADYISGAIAGDAGSTGYATSDSEGEDDPNHTIQLPQKYSGKGNVSGQKSALKLIELGPRLSIELIKVEKELGGGDVMYHRYIKKSPEEVNKIKKAKAEEQQLKLKRKLQQEQNVLKKQKLLEEKKEERRLRNEEKQQKYTQKQQDRDKDSSSSNEGGGESDSEED